jgi:hypothetical protein
LEDASALGVYDEDGRPHFYDIFLLDFILGRSHVLPLNIMRRNKLNTK